MENTYSNLQNVTSPNSWILSMMENPPNTPIIDVIPYSGLPSLTTPSHPTSASQDTTAITSRHITLTEQPPVSLGQHLQAPNTSSVATTSLALGQRFDSLASQPNTRDTLLGDIFRQAAAAQQSSALQIAHLSQRIEKAQSDIVEANNTIHQLKESLTAEKTQALETGNTIKSFEQLNSEVTKRAEELQEKVDDAEKKLQQEKLKYVNLEADAKQHLQKIAELEASHQASILLSQEACKKEQKSH